ncbi:MAG: ABC transporter transmembrane domain-containing protein [Candidatus Eisenbacteria bacterium]
MTLPKRVRDLSRFLRFRGRLAPYLAPHRGGFAGAIGLSLLFAAVRLLEPWPLQIVLDQVVLGKPTQLPSGIDPLRWVGGDPMLLLGLAAAAVLVFALVSGGIYYAQTVLVARIGQVIIRDLREDVFHHLLRHSLAFHRKNDPGDLLMRLTGDMIFLREMILATVVTMTGELIVLLSTLVLMFLVSPKLTLVTLAIAPALALLFRAFRGRMRDAARKQRKREGQIARRIAETLLAVPMIQSFTAETHEDDRFRKMCKRSERIGLRAARLEAGMQRTVEILIALGTCLVLWFGIREILAESITPGVFLVFLAYLRALFKPVRKLAKVAERTARASAAAERILEVLESSRDVKDSKKALPAPPLCGAIRLEDVGFTYEDGTVALAGITADVAPGEQIAIAGRSGAGKSTLFSILLGFHRPTSGRVYLDGQKARHFTLESLRKQIAYLPQDAFVVAGTVRENLHYGKPTANDEELWSALELAEIADYVRSLPGGLDAPIASRGQSLSGGQKQRLAIARAVLKDAPILLLDEPTSGLDPETEAAVLRSLGRLRSSRTTLVIAHRPETVRSADRVWILDRGQLIEDVAPDAVGEILLDDLADDRGAGHAVPGNRVAATSASSAAAGPPLPIPNLQYDEGVRGVARLAEPEGKKRFLVELDAVLDASSSRDAAEGATVSSTPRKPLAKDRSVELTGVKQRIGQRALLRVSNSAETWYVKLFRGRGGDRLAAAHATEAIANAAGIRIPRTLGWIDRYRALVIEDARGTAWFDLELEERILLARRLGASLSSLHARVAPEEWSRVEDERVRLDRAVDRAREHGGEVWTTISAFWESSVLRLFDERTAPDDPTARSAELLLVPIHGDVHPDQVRSGSGGALVLLDWDAAGLGEATRDIGNVLAHLELDAARGVLTEDEAQSLAEAFLGGVRSPVGRDSASVLHPSETGSRGGEGLEVRDVDIDWHRRSTLLRLAALYSDPSFGTRAPNPPTLALDLLRRADRRTRLASTGPTYRPSVVAQEVR